MSITSEPPKEAVLIVNLMSRHGYFGTNSAKRSLERCGVRVKRAFAVRSARHIPKLIEAATRNSEKFIVVGGGDGTIAAAAGPLAYTDAILGILPMGTGNDFARTLGIPLDLDGACRVLAEGKVVGVNLGRVNGDYFANAASVGFSARISRRATGWTKRVLGIGSYILGALVEFWLYRPFRATLTLNEQKRVIETSLIVVWNGRFHAGWVVAPTGEKGWQDKLLVYAPGAPSRLSLLQMATSLRMGWLTKAPPLISLVAESVSVEAEPPQEVDVDGEILHKTPVTIQLAPNALKVAVPQAFEG